MSYPPPGPPGPPQGPPPGGGYGPPHGGAPQGNPPEIGMAGLIFSLLCFWPLGIPALIFGMKVNSLWNQGDQAGAMEAHQKASKFRKLAFIIGGILWALSLVAMIFSLVASAMLVNEAQNSVDEYNTEMEQLEEDYQNDLDEY